MPLSIIKGDLLDQKTDAIVNAANEQLQMGGGVCGHIFNKAGAVQLQKACDEIGHCETGSAVLTPGFDLCPYIIHAVGPIYRNGRNNEERELRSAYRNALKLADKHKLESISFPLISAGIYGYPKKEAFKVAVNEIGNYLKTSESELNVYLVIYDDLTSFQMERFTIVRKLEMPRREFGLCFLNVAKEESCADNVFQVDYSHVKLDKSFVEKLFDIIDKKGLNEIEVYKNANQDRKQFSKMKTGYEEYHPSKQTALAYCIGANCDINETIDLLKAAGYSLSDSNLGDVIVKSYIEKGNYDIYDINCALITNEQKQLGMSY